MVLATVPFHGVFEQVLNVVVVVVVLVHQWHLLRVLATQLFHLHYEMYNQNLSIVHISNFSCGLARIAKCAGVMAKTHDKNTEKLTQNE